MSPRALLLLVLAAGLPASAAEVITVANSAQLRAALARLQPGHHLRLAPGEYGPGYVIDRAHGTATQPIVIEGSDPANPPRFAGGAVALHVRGASYLTLRHLAAHGQSGNGLNLDDGGASSHHVTLDRVVVSDTGPTGNRDGIKLSGIDDFVLRECRVSGWAGQAVDMVGCHRGLLEKCRFEGKPGFAQTTGPQTKGGSEDIVIRACVFLQAGQRPAHLGGSTGRPYFRPRDAKYEARRITLEGCLIVGGMAGVTFTGIEEGIARFNTIVDTERWPLRILQENQEPGMLECGRNTFENNLLVVTHGELRSWLNIGGRTRPETFKFAGNWWYLKGPAQASKPALPAPETGGTYGVDPQLDPAANYAPRLPAAQKVGHTAFKSP
jgi:hypothetical protein